MSQNEKSNVSYLFLLVVLVTGSIIFIVKMKPWESKKETGFNFNEELDDFDVGQKFTTKQTTLKGLISLKYSLKLPIIFSFSLFSSAKNK